MGVSTSLQSGASDMFADTPRNEKCVPVIVDIETCGFSPTAEIIQVAARRGTHVFECYMLPVGFISEDASRVNGFTKHNGALLYKGVHVKTTPPAIAATEFIAFLRNMGSQIILVGHNIIRFDGPRLLRWVNNHSLLDEFERLVHGFSDTLKLLGKGEVKKGQEVLARKFLGPEWQSVLDSAHNASTDCQILEALLSHFEVTEENVLENAVSLTALARQAEKRTKAKEARASLQLLKGHISSQMIGRLVSANVTFEVLMEEFKRSGGEGLKLFLGQRVDGKVMVTNNPKIIKKIIEFVSERHMESTTLPQI